MLEIKYLPVYLNILWTEQSFSIFLKRNMDSGTRVMIVDGVGDARLPEITTV